MPTKKASSKKASSKKASATKTVKATALGSKLRLDFPLDPRRIAAIQRCIAKGTLTVTVNKVDLSAGKLKGPWLYD